MRLSSLLVAFGLSIENVFLPFLYIIVPFLPIAIPIAFLFGVMTSFARFSADGEYIALLAAGFNLRRALVPVLGFAVVLFGIATFCGMNLEAWGRREFERFVFQKTQTELDSMIRLKLQERVFNDNFLGYVFYAERISQDRQHYFNVMVSSSSQSEDSDFVMTAESAEILGSVHDGNLTMSFINGILISPNASDDEVSILNFERSNLNMLRVFKDRILHGNDYEGDYRSYPFLQLGKYVDTLRAALPENQRVYWRARYLFHARMVNCLLLFAFALLGAVLGLYDPRQSRNWSYSGSILVVIASYVFMAFTRWAAEQGHLHGMIAAWLPQVVIFAIAVLVAMQRNRLPPAESVFSLKHLGWRNAPVTIADHP